MVKNISMTLNFHLIVFDIFWPIYENKWSFWFIFEVSFPACVIIIIYGLDRANEKTFLMTKKKSIYLNIIYIYLFSLKSHFSFTLLRLQSFIWLDIYINIRHGKCDLCPTIAIGAKSRERQLMIFTIFHCTHMYLFFSCCES